MSAGHSPAGLQKGGRIMNDRDHLLILIGGIGLVVRGLASGNISPGLVILMVVVALGVVALLSD